MARRADERDCGDEGGVDIRYRLSLALRVVTSKTFMRYTAVTPTAGTRLWVVVGLEIPAKDGGMDGGVSFFEGGFCALKSPVEQLAVSQVE